MRSFQKTRKQLKSFGRLSRKSVTCRTCSTLYVLLGWHTGLLAQSRDKVARFASLLRGAPPLYTFTPLLYFKDQLRGGQLHGYYIS